MQYEIVIESSSDQIFNGKTRPDKMDPNILTEIRINAAVLAPIHFDLILR